MEATSIPSLQRNDPQFRELVHVKVRPRKHSAGVSSKRKRANSSSLCSNDLDLELDFWPQESAPLGYCTRTVHSPHVVAGELWLNSPGRRLDFASCRTFARLPEAVPDISTIMIVIQYKWTTTTTTTTADSRPITRRREDC